MGIWTDIDEQLYTLGSGLVSFYRFSEPSGGVTQPADPSKGLNQDFPVWFDLGPSGYHLGDTHGVIKDGKSVFPHNQVGSGISETIFQQAIAHQSLDDPDVGPSGNANSNSRFTDYFNFKERESWSCSLWVNPQNMVPVNGDGIYQDRKIVGRWDNGASTFRPEWKLELLSEKALRPEARFRFTMTDFRADSVENFAIAQTSEVLTGLTNPEFYPAVPAEGRQFDIHPGRWYHICFGYHGPLDADGIGLPRPGPGIWMVVNNAVSGAPDQDGKSDGALGGLIRNPTPGFTSLQNQTNVPFRIGTLFFQGGEDWEGVIDAVGFWDRPLQSGEVKALYNEGRGLELPLLSPPRSEIGGFMQSDTITQFRQSDDNGVLIGDPSGVIPIGGYMFSRGIQVPLAHVGGYQSAQPPRQNTRQAIIGGILQSEPFTQVDARIGAIVWAVELADNNFFAGGYADSRFQPDTFDVGGFCFGKPDFQQFAETRPRTVVKATSDDVIDQTLDVDATIVFKGVSNQDFKAKFDIFQTSQSIFGAQLNVQKFKNLPNVFITDVTFDDGIPSGIPHGLLPSGTTVTVTASGILGDGLEFSNTSIDFGDPAIGPIGTFDSTSGFITDPPWTASYTYTTSGIYTVTVRGEEDIGSVGMDFHQVNFASGLTIGVDYPAISISGIPRLGIVPPNLGVQFTTQFSGVGALTGNVSDDIEWDFGTGAVSQRINASGNYSEPGHYVPVLRYAYRNPQGNVINVSDTLRVGFNF
jgi:hypothetical protein